MAVKLHRCGNRARFGPCWKKALDDQGITYEVVRGPWRPRDRATVIEGHGAVALSRDRVRGRELVCPVTRSSRQCHRLVVGRLPV